VKRILKI